MYTFEDRIPVHNGTTHEHHAVPGHGSRRGIIDVVYFEHNLTIRCHGDSIAISQGQGLVVIKDRVEILDPDGIYRSIQYQPDVVTLKVKIKRC